MIWIVLYLLVSFVIYCGVFLYWLLLAPVEKKMTEDELMASIFLPLLWPLFSLVPCAALWLFANEKYHERISKRDDESIPTDSEF